ncbi:uncharacterized protein BDR25DRAFT_304057 [Lindgomyces ingoldianus]|uniref:Uncharacterized protein n=1 Tax=Lindgomyces ingoldianus TaxID=673940 RepID=A0ACB6QTB5_9PLEO|nr:uncharacterized protein BDR25DRAFT_304057 [Lindgomyces ingoldianus]KAF2470087.1 hypothetical protein BDR25DRAFT_304057 [Lindgomyces ingoldianus]
MSTAIALQDMRPTDPNTQQAGILRQRHRSPSQHGIKEATITTHDSDSDWIMNPQDNSTSHLPVDSQSFVPTNTYWITPHGMLAKDIKILDLTSDITLPYTGLTSSYKDHVKITLKDHSFSPIFTVHRGNWWGLKYSITDAEGGTVADWKHPWHSAGEAVLTFPDDSAHSSHAISLTNKRWGFRTETFTLNSVPFEWKMDSLWHSQDMTLCKIFGSGQSEKRVEVAKYAQKWWGGFVTGGTFVVDEGEVDGLVACLTLMVVLKKKRQRQAERSGGGGGGGGGGS